MVNTEKIVEPKSATYAVAKDFCRIFEQDMNRLYLLSLLLTADHTKAQQCFVGGLQDSSRSQRVFQEWAHSWARRMVIQSAIQLMYPRAAGSDAASGRADRAAERVEIAAVLDLPVFERFVFVLSVLERYSDQDCALLLGGTRGEVVAARTRALQQIARAAETYRTTRDSRETVPEVALAMRIESVPLLATLP